VKISQTASTAVDCVAELAGLVRDRLGAVSPVFATAANAMEEWVNLWKSHGLTVFFFLFLLE
jgi:reversibly glycosylated polypeptide / UDP-arabinopyranose mutase